ncbi:MAG: hypothetical protein ACW99G_01700 [Candidatus Thorarchaeota archaeon]|jgi:hypothetical protein
MEDRLNEMNDQVTAKAGKGLKDGIILKAVLNLHGILRNSEGEIIDEQKVSNQVQTYMKTHVADMLSDQGENNMGWMSIGTGSGQGVGDSSLASQSTRQALDGSTPSHSGAVVTYHRTFAAGEGTGTMTEAGVHESAAAGNMGLYTDSINFAKGAGDSLELTWTLTVS